MKTFVLNDTWLLSKDKLNWVINTVQITAFENTHALNVFKSQTNGSFTCKILHEAHYSLQTSFYSQAQKQKQRNNSKI